MAKPENLGPDPHPDCVRKEGPNRFWFCVFYDRCLNVAIRENWESFCCYEKKDEIFTFVCPAFEEALPSYTEVISDYGEDTSDNWDS